MRYGVTRSEHRQTDKPTNSAWRRAKQ